MLLARSFVYYSFKLIVISRLVKQRFLFSIRTYWRYLVIIAILNR